MRGGKVQGWIGRVRKAAWLPAAMALFLPGRAGAAAGMRIEVAAAPAQGRVVREIDDPATGERWLLLRNERNPGGPEQLVLAGVGAGGADAAHARAKSLSQVPRALPVIRTGDRLIVEEHTPVVDAELEALALGTATRGAALNVRLRIGGRVVRAVALGPGRAELAPEAEVWP
ncbi:MAG: hypothetical protein ACP5FH_03215 [Terracidiphilus sp.]